MATMRRRGKRIKRRRRKKRRREALKFLPAKSKKRSRRRKQKRRRRREVIMKVVGRMKGPRARGEALRGNQKEGGSCHFPLIFCLVIFGFWPRPPSGHLEGIS